MSPEQFGKSHKNFPGKLKILSAGQQLRICYLLVMTASCKKRSFFSSETKFPNTVTFWNFFQLPTEVSQQTVLGNTLAFNKGADEWIHSKTTQWRKKIWTDWWKTTHRSNWPSDPERHEVQFAAAEAKCCLASGSSFPCPNCIRWLEKIFFLKQNFEKKYHFWKLWLFESDILFFVTLFFKKREFGTQSQAMFRKFYSPVNTNCFPSDFENTLMLFIIWRSNILNQNTLRNNFLKCLDV